MREIKFRAWDKTKNRWCEFGEIAGVWGVNDGGEIVFDLVDDIELMQATGLKDKTGNEIYEGDIVSMEDEEKIVVRWIDENAFYCPFGNSDPKSLSADEVTVIGNAYNNPELIK